MLYSGIATHSGNCYYANTFFKQTANIDLSAYYWQPLGIICDRSGVASYRYFSGNYDGSGYTVSGVFTPSGSTNAYDSQGLFGCLFGQNIQASIKNVGVIDSYIQGYCSVGGICGYSYMATIENCYNAGVIKTANGWGIGGIVGDSYGEITNCYNTGEFMGNDEGVGGIVGQTSCASVMNCYNTGSVSGTGWSVGGVVGWSEEGELTLTNCYNTGSVSGVDGVGGIVGLSYQNNLIKNCKNYGNVSTSSTQWAVAGIVGELNSGCAIEDCYNEGNVAGKTYIAGIVGYMWEGTAVSNSFSKATLNGQSSVGSIVGSLVSGTVSNCAGYGMIISADASTTGSIVGTIANTSTITNCSFDGNANRNGLLICGAMVSTTINGCYAKVNREKIYMGSNFSGYTVVENMNNNLPMQNELFAIDKPNSDSDVILDYLKGLGFEAIG